MAERLFLVAKPQSVAAREASIEGAGNWRSGVRIPPVLPLVLLKSTINIMTGTIQSEFQLKRFIAELRPLVTNSITEEVTFFMLSAVAFSSSLLIF